MWVVLNQTKNGLPELCFRSMKSSAPVDDLVVDRLHPLLRERAGVLDRVLAALRDAALAGRRAARSAPGSCGKSFGFG